jgi:hypothetical protein
MIVTTAINNVNGNGSALGVPALTASLVLPEREEIRGMNVHQRIQWITAEARSLPKSQWNPDGAFPYAGHDQIVDMLRLLLAKYGINIYQEPIPEFKRDISLSGFEHLTRVWYEYEVVNADNPDDKFVKHNWGEALDNGDKGLNKCSTIAEKMFMLRLFKISTFDDPDAHSAEKTHNRPVPQNGSDKGRRDRVTGPAQNECQDCHQLITTCRRENKTWQSSEVIAAAKRQFGKRLCVDCYLAAVAKAAKRPSEVKGTSVSHLQKPGEPVSAEHSPAAAPASTPDGNRTSEQSEQGKAITQ